MNLETKLFVEGLLVKYIQDVPTSSEQLFMNEMAHITSIDIVDELCEALTIFEDNLEKEEEYLCN